MEAVKKIGKCNRHEADMKPELNILQHVPALSK